MHPQTYLNEPRIDNLEWVSGFILDAQKIHKITAIQINPTNKFINTNLFLFREGTDFIANSNKHGVIPPMGARLVEWDLLRMGIKDGYISVAARGLPTINAKPILLTHFDDGSFSGMHG